MSTYQPLSGSIAFKVIEHLKTLKPDEEIATGPLCDAVGLDRADQINSFMLPALNAGVVSRRNIAEKGRMNWWRLVRPGELKVAMPAAAQEHKVDLPAVTVTHEKPPAAGEPAGALAPAKSAKADMPVPRFQDAPAPAAKPAKPSKPEPKPEVNPGVSTTFVEGGVVVFTDPPAEPEEPQEPDAWISARTGAIVLTGVEPDPEDGSITLLPELVANIRELLR